jgi:hypothetical protein
MLAALFFVDWIFYGAAAVLVLGGVIAFPFALFRDRSRGRRRCPKCWYDMSGTPGLTCPECGRTAKRERKLHRTRRRWRLAALAVLLIIAGLGTWYGEHVRRVGWVKAAPTVYYIARLPDLDQNTTLRELAERVQNGELRQWQYHLLLHRCIGILEAQEAEPGTLVEVADLIAMIVGLGQSGPNFAPWGCWARVSDADETRAISALCGLLEHEDRDVRISAIGAISGFEGHHASATLALLGQLLSSDWKVRDRAANQLRSVIVYPNAPHFPFWTLNPLNGVSHFDPQEAEWSGFLDDVTRCGTNVDCALSHFVDGLDSERPEVRAIAIWALTRLPDVDADTRLRVLDLGDDENALVRQQVVEATRVLPPSDRIREVIRGALQDRSLDRYSTLRAIAAQGSEGLEIKDELLAVLDDLDSGIVDAAVDAWVAIGGDPAVVRVKLLEPLDDLSSYGTNWMLVESLECLARYDLGSPDLRERIEPLLDDRRPQYRRAAAVAFAACGGDPERATRVLVALVRNREPGAADDLYLLAKGGSIPIPVVTELLNSSNANERYAAVDAVEAMGRRAACLLPQLRELQSDPDPRIAYVAEYAVKRIEYEREHENDD